MCASRPETTDTIVQWIFRFASDTIVGRQGGASSRLPTSGVSLPIETDSGVYRRFVRTSGVGHEIGNVVRRHSVQQLQKAERRDVGLVLLCTLTRACSSIGKRVAIRVGNDALSARYSQHDEAEADSEGVVNTVRAGIDPEGLPSFFEKLLGERQQQPTAFEAFFSTHPTDARRVAATRAQIAALAVPPGRTLVRDASEFHVMQARVRALPVPPTLGSTP